MLSACSVRQPIPQIIEEPEISIEEPDRTPPYGAMGEPEGFPAVPANVDQLTGEQQARVLVQTIARAAERYRSCELKRQVLIDWIINEPIPIKE